MEANILFILSFLFQAKAFTPTMMGQDGIYMNPSQMDGFVYGYYNPRTNNFIVLEEAVQPQSYTPSHQERGHMNQYDSYASQNLPHGDIVAIAPAETSAKAAGSAHQNVYKSHKDCSDEGDQVIVVGGAAKQPPKKEAAAAKSDEKQKSKKKHNDDENGIEEIKITALLAGIVAMFLLK